MSEAGAVLLAKASQMRAALPLHVALTPGDVVEVKFFNIPDLNESQTVRPDGKIALQLIGEVKVKEKSPAELRDDLLKLYAPHSKTPEIAVVIRSFYDRHVFVGGQVMAPGIVETPGSMTLLEKLEFSNWIRIVLWVDI